MKIKLLVIAMFLACFNSDLYSQIYINGKKYNSTVSFNFKQKPSILDIGEKIVYVTVARKNDTQGIFYIDAPSEGYCVLRGGIIIYLDNGNIIKCVSRNLFDKVDDRTIGAWYLTTEEINEMKYSDISSIVFTLFEYETFYKKYSASNYKALSTSYHIRKLFK